MDLWTEFEGVTIDSSFALNKLLQTEGRSAFFSTLNANGESVLIRIVECHFDEDEIQARWRGIETLGHPNFLRIDHFGQFLIEEDGITAVYAVFERVDANLGQVLERGRLSTADAAQIGLSIASALETLHAHGFVHQHVETRNIFAVGETVKLRSDCTRETPEGEAGVAARRRDVHDLAEVLQQVLIGAPRFSQSIAPAALPAPFDEVVRNGMSGQWGLTEIQAALASHRAQKGSRLPAKASATANENRTGKLDFSGSTPAAVQRPSQAAAKANLSAEKPADTRPGIRIEPGIGRTTGGVSPEAERTVFTRESRAFGEESNWKSFFEDPLRRWIVGGALLAAVLLIGLFVIHRGSVGHATTHAKAALGQHGPTDASRQNSASVEPKPSPTAAPRSVSAPGVQWRVVAFTYNRKDQAQKKASALMQKHPDLRPEVFSSNGRAPWLVTIGGPMQRDAAYALARKARSMGLPRDTYAQNYTAR